MFFFVAILAGLILFNTAMYFTETIMRKKYSTRSIFIGFRQKIWMTTGLGIVFFGLYFLIVTIGSFLDPETRLNLFFLVYQNPVAFIYLGLLTFICISISILMVRHIIKFLYNARSKN